MREIDERLRSAKRGASERSKSADPAALSTLRTLSAEYIGARRTAGELRSRLAAIVRERSVMADTIADNGDPSAAHQRLADLDRRRTVLDRSSRTAAERTNALEALIAAIALTTGGRLRASHGSDNIGAAGQRAEAGASSTDALLELGGKVC